MYPERVGAYLGYHNDMLIEGVGYFENKDPQNLVSDWYFGEWKYNMRDGIGIYWNSVEKIKYKGEFKENKPHGCGIFLYKDGSSYKGQIVDGKREGMGIFTYSNGDKYKGLWENDDMVGG